MKPSLRHHGCRISEYEQAGHTVVVLENDLIRVSILLSKGADIVEFRHKPTDIDVLWHSARPRPALANYGPETATGRDVFYDTFVGGWQESFPTGNTFGAYQGANLTVHGEVSLLPWDCTVLEDTAASIRVAFDVECRRMPFRLRRVMILSRGAGEIHFEETIENLAANAMAYAWGHHPAFGPPFLTPGCILDLPAGTVSTRPPGAHPTPRLAQGRTWETLHATSAAGESLDLRRVHPEHGGTSDNFEIKLSGAGQCALRNPDAGIGFGLSWDANAFPYLWEWEVSRGGGAFPLWGREYLLALEPFNCPVGGGLHTHGDTLPRLQPGGKNSAWLVAGFCDGRQEFAGKYLQRPDA